MQKHLVEVSTGTTFSKENRKGRVSLHHGSVYSNLSCNIGIRIR